MPLLRTLLLLLLAMPMLHRPKNVLPLPLRELLPPPDMAQLPRTNLSTTVPTPTPLPRECDLPLRDPKLLPREAKLPPLVSDLPPRDQELPSAVSDQLPRTSLSTTVPAPLPLPRELSPPSREPKVPPREANQPQLAAS